MISSIIAAAAAQEHGGAFDPFEFAPGAVFWTWVIFLLSIPVMWKFVFGPITRALADRDQRVTDAAQAAEEARRQAEDAVAQAKREREEARAEGRRMVQEATARAERQAQEAQRRAEEEAERQLEKARSEIEAEKRRALLEIREEVVELAIRSARQILRREVDDQAHRELVSSFVSDLEQRSH